MTDKKDETKPERCDGCRFSRIGDAFTGVRDHDGNPHFQIERQCRRNPPLAAIDPGGLRATLWPVVASDDWCGEWKRKL